MATTQSVRRAAVLVLALALPLAAAAGVVETKSLTRAGEPVVVKGSALPDFVGLSVNNADVTLAPQQFFAWAYDAATGWRQVVFQVDEINNAYPALPPPVTTGGCRYGHGPNYMDGDDGVWDANDEVVFISGEAGDRVTQDEWAPGASTTAVRYEITVVDPLDPSKKGWVYLFRHDALPTWRTDDYVAWNETSNTVTAAKFTVDYPDSHTSAVYFSTLSVSAAGGGTGANMVQKSKLSWNGGFTTNCTSNETQIRTSMTITGGGCGDFSLPWYAKDGRVRVLRYFMWMPWRDLFSFCGMDAGIGMYPGTFVYYYPGLWYEQQYMNFRGGQGHCNWIQGSVNHASTTAMTFYDGNGESCAINGTAETLAQKPLWDWFQVSSPYGSYIHLPRVTEKDAADRWNVYTDSGTGQRGDAGWYISDPTENTSEPAAWHEFYYFFLPADAANQGSTYNGYVQNPLTPGTPAGQSFSSAPAFSGVQSAEDVNGACADEGVRLTWAAATDWKDGCTADCTGRRYEITRGGSALATVTDTAATTYVDLTGTDGLSYDYGVEACGHTGQCTSLGTTVAGMDYVSAPPLLSGAATTVADSDACTGAGITVTWSAPSDWRDGGSGSRTVDLYWDADGYAAPVAAGIVSPATYDAPDGEAHTYRLRAVNGCGLGVDYDLSASVTDVVGAAPALPADGALHVADPSACSLSGLQFTWEAVAAWGDGGQGTRGYDLYWSRDGYASPIVAGAASPATFAPGDSLLTTYRVVARNGCALTAAYAEAALADGQTAPAFAGVASVADGDTCLASALTLSWPAVAGDGVTGWNDGGTGAGTHHFEIYRDGLLVASPSETATSASHQPPATNTPYTFTVRAVNRNGCYTDGGASVSGTDFASVAPTAAPAQTSVVDVTCAAGTGVTVSWDAVSDWGDGGQGASNRRYRVFWSGNNYGSPIASLVDGTTSWVHNPPDNLPYAYRVQARNGCVATLTYATSAGVLDKTSCSPPCTPVLENTFDGSNDFVQSCNGGQALWALAPGAGLSGTQAWRFTTPQGTGPLTVDSSDVPKVAVNGSVTSTLTTTTAQPAASATVFWAVSDAHSDPAHYSVEIQGPAGGAFTMLKAMGVSPDPEAASITALYNAAGQGPGIYTLRLTHSSAGSSPKQATLTSWSITADDGQTPTDATASIEMATAKVIAWTSDVKLRFWSSVDLSADDAGVVEVWTDDSAVWRKATAMLYPALAAEVPASVNLVCASDVLPVPQPAFQGTVPGAFYEARLDGLLTAGTTQVKVRFKAAVGGTAGPGTWTVDEVKLGYGITDGVYYWSLGGDPLLGALRQETGTEALLNWEDAGFYQTQEFRIYRSANPAAIRTDPSTALAHTEPDTDAASYTFTTADGAPAEGACWYYKLYGYKEPCGESDSGEN